MVARSAPWLPARIRLCRLAVLAVAVGFVWQSRITANSKFTEGVLCPRCSSVSGWGARAGAQIPGGGDQALTAGYGDALAVAVALLLTAATVSLVLPARSTS